jgi:Protein of unknown function (DUF3108)
MEVAGGRLAIAALAAAGMIAAAAAATAPEGTTDRFDLRYEIYGFAGLHLLTDRTMLDLSPGRYAITMDLQTRGIAGIVASLKSHSEVQGRLIGDGVYPEEFRGEVLRDGTLYRSRVDYRPDGTVIVEASPPPPDIHLAAVGMRGTVDQLSAYLMLERRLARVGNCALSVPVYDGRLRYDLFFRDAERQPGTAAGGVGGAASMRICEMQRREVAGFSVEPNSGGGASSGRIWYAPLLPHELMVPVKMEFATEFGTVDGRLAELHGHGADFTFNH